MIRPKKTKHKLPASLPSINPINDKSKNNNTISLDKNQIKSRCSHPNIYLQLTPAFKLQEQNCSSIKKLVLNSYDFESSNKNVSLQLQSKSQIQYQINKQKRKKLKLRSNKQYKSDNIKNSFVRYHQLESNENHQKWQNSSQRKLINILKRNSLKSIKRNSTKSYTIDSLNSEDPNISRNCLYNFFNKDKKKEENIAKKKLEGENILIILRPKDKNNKLKYIHNQKQRKKKQEQRYYSEFLSSPKCRLKYNQATLSGWKTNNQQQLY